MAYQVPGTRYVPVDINTDAGVVGDSAFSKPSPTAELVHTYVRV